MTGCHKWFSSGFLSICIFLIWIFLNTSPSFDHCYDVQFDAGGVWMMILKSTCCQLMKDFESLWIRFKVWSIQRPAPMLRCSWSVIWNNVELFQITWNNTVTMWIIPLPIVHMVSWWAQELELQAKCPCTWSLLSPKQLPGSSLCSVRISGSNNNFI